MEPSTNSSPPGSLVRSRTGEPLQGFARDFIRESIKATLKYPQTQAVIRLAVAGVILDTVSRGAEREIIDLYIDLQGARPCSIDLRAVARFVHLHYRALQLPIPEIPEEAYARLFKHEIEKGFRSVASSHLSCVPESVSKASRHERLGFLLSSEDSFDIHAWCAGVRGLGEARNVALRGALAGALRDLYRDPRQKVLRDFLLRGLQREPREGWHFNVIFPYAATVTKMGMNAERRYLDELKMPPIGPEAQL